MKSKFTISGVFLLIALIISCSEDDFNGKVSLEPFVEIKSPGVVVAGVPADLKVTVYDGMSSPLSSVELELLDNEDAVVVSKTVNFSGDEEMNEITWTAAETEIADFESGSYEFRVTATDSDGNEKQNTITVPVVPLPVACEVDGKATIVLITSSEIPAGRSMGMIGQIEGTSWNQDFVMNRITAGVYCVAVTINNGASFKFRIDGNWSFQGANGDNCNSDMADQTYTGTGTGLTVFTIPKFRGVAPCN